jgi:plasmid stability protein
MPDLTIRSIPKDIYERLEASAERHRRSLDSEVIHCLDRALPPRRRDVEETLARLDALRRRVKLGNWTDEEITLAKREGRR